MYYKLIKPSVVIYILISLFTADYVVAKPVTIQQVQKAATTFINAKYPGRTINNINTASAAKISPITIKNIQNWQDNKNRTAGYIINTAPAGYILMRVDDELPPIKLYSENGSFSNLPPAFLDAMQFELKGELSVLQKQQQNNKSPLGTSRFTAEWNALTSSAITVYQTESTTPPATTSTDTYGPLLITTWNQDDPYNYYAPAAAGGPDGRAYAGCVACAMSQILRFHTMPAKITDDFSYTDSDGDCTGTHAASDAGLGDYDWANMPTAIYNSSPLAEIQAVGRLMYHCAVTVKMDFEYDGSGASSANVPGALRNYFDYVCSDLEWREDFSDAEWYGKLEADIKASQPVFYRFQNTDGGHAVVCDGTQNGNELHINFGWGGSDNAWYNMDSINGFYYYHGAIFNIRPSFEIITTELPTGMERVPYSFQLEQTNGTPPCIWGLSDKYMESSVSNTYTETGIAHNWCADDQTWSLTIPFNFPFFGKTYTNCWIDSNGKINFEPIASDYTPTKSELINNTTIAVLWNDLTTDSGYDIFTTNTADSIKIRWHARFVNEGAPVNMSATLYSNGNVRLSYGYGNILGGMIGISSGKDNKYLISSLSESGQMEYTKDIMFVLGSKLPPDLQISTNGIISGIPQHYGTTRVIFMVTDANGIKAYRAFDLNIITNWNLRPVINYTLPDTGDYNVPEHSSEEFNISATDPEGSNLVYQWSWNGINIGNNNATCIITNTGTIGTNELGCVISDGFWTNEVKALWNIIALPDTDTDGLPDQWEYSWVTNLSYLTENGDYDNDGMTDSGERIAGTSPTNPASIFTITGINASTNCILTWNSVTDRLYTVLTTPDILQNWSNSGFMVEGDGTPKCYTNSNTNAASLFYRINVNKIR